MVVVPVAMPPATPLVLSMVPTEAVLLLHVPPAVLLVSVVVAPTHTADAPPMAAGLGLMVTVMAASGPQQPPADCDLK